MNDVDIPFHVYEYAKIAYLDWIGITIAGKDNPLVKKLLGYVNILGCNEQATILGHPSVTMFPSLLALSEFKEKSGEEKASRL